MIIADKIVIPEFATEGDWLYEHREEHGKIMGKAMKEGRTIPAREFWAKRGMKFDTVRVSLNSADVDLAREQAEALGIETEFYPQELVHEAVTGAR